jgi:hypothetical protein
MNQVKLGSLRFVRGRLPRSFRALEVRGPNSALPVGLVSTRTPLRDRGSHRSALIGGKGLVLSRWLQSAWSSGWWKCVRQAARSPRRRHSLTSSATGLRRLSTHAQLCRPRTTPTPGEVSRPSLRRLPSKTIFLETSGTYFGSKRPSLETQDTSCCCRYHHVIDCVTNSKSS